MTCGPHSTSRQKAASTRRNTHVAAVTRQTFTRRSNTTASAVLNSSRQAALDLRRAELARAKPHATRPGVVHSKQATSARDKAHATARNTAAKHAAQTARAHAEAHAAATARKNAKQAASEHAKETARQHFMADRTCHQNTRDAVQVRVPAGQYRSYLREALRANKTFHGQGFKPRKPAAAAKASKSFKAVKAQRAR